MTADNIGIGNIVYFARIHHATGVYEVCELRVRTVYEDSFVGVDKDSKQAFLISNDSINDFVFSDRRDAVAVVNEAEKLKKKLTTESEG